jgi:hypothetical protein
MGLAARRLYSALAPPPLAWVDGIGGFGIVWVPTVHSVARTMHPSPNTKALLACGSGRLTMNSVTAWMTSHNAEGVALLFVRGDHDECATDHELCHTPLNELKALLFYSSGGIRKTVHGARFWAGFCTRGCHWIPRMFASSEHACDQWHSSREPTALTVSIINYVNPPKAVFVKPGPASNGGQKSTQTSTAFV